MGIHRRNLRWGIIHRKIFRSSSHHHQQHHQNNNIIVLHTNDGNFSEDFNSSASEYNPNAGSEFLVSREDIAAITIQASFRAHLARRAYSALKGLVKLQALVRGVLVRRQAQIAFCCMKALARLQITVRARQLLIETHI